MIEKLLEEESGEDNLFTEIESNNKTKGLRSFNVTTTPHNNDCNLTSSTITYTKQLILNSKLTANITVVKTPIYIDDDCNRQAKAHEGMCITAKAIGVLGAMWTTTITAVLLDSEHNTVTVFTKTSANDGNCHKTNLLATSTTYKKGGGLVTKSLA